MAKKIEVGRVGNGIKVHKFTKSLVGLVPLCMVSLYVTDDMGGQSGYCNDAENAVEGTEDDVTCKTCRKMMKIK